VRIRRPSASRWVPNALVAVTNCGSGAGMPKLCADRIIMFSLVGLVAWALIGLPIVYSHSPAPTGSSNGCVYRILDICFVTSASDTKIFGFAEFVQAFALLVLIYTISDVRYRFRAETAPIPIRRTTFWISVTIGLGTLATDLWFARGYPLPWFLASQPYWQAALGLMFLSMVLIWIWFAFVRPPVFGKHNAFNFTRALYAYLLQGAEQDLPIIAAELGRSARAIVQYVNEPPDRGRREARDRAPSPANYASDVLLLIGNRKFCRHIMAASPGTAIAFFQAMSEFRKYRIPIGQFASNLSSEALLNRDSILYHEDEGYYSGFFGYVRPFTNAVYGDFLLVEALTEGKSPLDINLDVRWALDSQQVEAYARAVLTTFESLLDEQRFHSHSYALYRAFDVIEHATDDLYKLDDLPEGLEANDIRGRLRAVVHFINEAIELLDKHGVQPTVYRRHNEQHMWHKDYYDNLADLMFEVIANAASMKAKGFKNWSVHFSTIWAQFFHHHKSATRKIVLFKLRRLLYDEVLQLGRAPNFRSGAILGYLLNVLGVKEGPRRDHRAEEYQLRKSVITWARRNFLGLLQRYGKVALAIPRGTISFDEHRGRLVKTYIEGLELVAPTDILDLDRPTRPDETDEPKGT
jgi:hypothetical protein